MSSRRRALARSVVAVAAVAAATLGLQLGQFVLAVPALAHAELVETTPANGQRLTDAPAQILLEFSEPVSLVTGGLRLLETETGEVVTTPEPRTVGDTVRWPLPNDLPDGAYLVSWRVVSTDSHPVAGAFTFGIGVDATPVTQEVTVGDPPWQLALTRCLGYLGFAVVAGAWAVASLCWPTIRSDERMTALLRSGMVVSFTATALLFPLQGPYESDASYLHLFDPSLLSEVADTDFGAWTALRGVLVALLAALLWRRGAIASSLVRWASGVVLVTTALTFPSTGHAASGDRVDRLVDLMHVLAASVWVGGLVVLAAMSFTRGPRPPVDAFRRFSGLALGAVVAIAVTGVLNALLRLESWSQLWESRYGVTLGIKVALVLAVLVLAAWSRRAVRRTQTPVRTVQAEAVGTVLVLAVTSVLTLTPPANSSTTAGGSDGGPGASGDQHVGHDQQDDGGVSLSLGDGRGATLQVSPPGPDGSFVLVELQEGLTARSVSLRASLPEQQVEPLDVPLHRTLGGWSGLFRFPLAGRWTMELTVEFGRLDSVVTQGSVTVPSS